MTTIEYQCAACGDIITPGTMNAMGCTLAADGWRCGFCEMSAGWNRVHVDEISTLRASSEFACLTPAEDCQCAGCLATAESEREMT